MLCIGQLGRAVSIGVFLHRKSKVDQFEVAFRGVQALGLDGVALFDPFQSAVIPLLESVTESALCLGRVNVARSDGNSWLGDNTLGTALLQCIETHHRHADDQPAVLVLNSESLAKVIRLAPSTNIVDVISIDGESGPLDVGGAIVNDARLGDSPEQTPDIPNSDSSLSPSVTVESIVKVGKKIGTLVVNDLPSLNALRRLSSLHWCDAAKCIVVGHKPEKQMRPFREWAASKNIELVQSVEVMAYQAAADFHFWTGVSPSLEQIRDSLEEYLQW